MRTLKRIFVFCLCIFLLTGCWSSQEIDDVALVHGVGFERIDNKLSISAEIIKPTNPSRDGNNEADGGQHLVLEISGDTFFEGAREFIRYAKRRLNFEHCLVWLIGEELAREGFLYVLDGLQRDQMFRLNSYIFITEDDPTNILGQPTLYENLVSTELVSALDHTQFLGGFTPMKLSDFYQLMQGIQHNAYVPIIRSKTVNGQKITSIEETAVIKDEKMIGKLNSEQSFGLNWINDNIKGGGITVSFADHKNVSFEIMSASTTIEPSLKGEQLFVTIAAKVQTALSDNWLEDIVDNQLFGELETAISKKIEEIIANAMRELQQTYKADITQIGEELHRKDPQGWHRVEHKWDDDVFANAIITYDITAEITHPGLMKESMPNYNEKKPSRNPYHILLKGAS